MEIWVFRMTEGDFWMTESGLDITEANSVEGHVLKTSIDQILGFDQPNIDRSSKKINPIVNFGW